MKKPIMKVLSILCAVALMFSCIGTSVFAVSSKEIAQDAIAYDNLNGNNQGEAGPSNIND